MSAIRTFVSQIVDYAGLFPPAALPMPETVENYANYVGGESSWMLARLIVPVGRLSEFEEVADAFLPKSSDNKPWLISALVPAADAPDNGLKNGLNRIDEFNRKHVDPDCGLARVDTIELKAPTIENIEKTGQAVPEHINAFLELPHTDDPNELVERIKQGPDHLYAKIRTGGVTQDLIPPADQVARFIDRCRRHSVGFKATAGLHHPIRGEYRLTYEDASDHGTMFGFVNVFAASCFAFGCDASETDLANVLTETDMTKFQFDDGRLTWESFAVDADKISDIRNRIAVSFGSCSFDEPTNELKQLLSLTAS